MKSTILFADNDEGARKSWGEYLEGQGYTVALAASPEEAQKALNRQNIDLALIDVRLVNDDLETDYSGLLLAASSAFCHIPKIMLTGHKPPPYEEQRKVWAPIGGQPPAVLAFVGKSESPKVLLKEIEHALEIWPHLSLLSSKVSERIEKDHDTIRKQARQNYGLSIAFSIVGFVIIITSIVLAAINQLGIGIVGSITGLILEALGYLFFRQLELANRRMDVYHQELLQTYGVEFILSIAARLPAEQESGCVEKTVAGVLSSWYPGGSRSGLLPGADPEPFMDYGGGQAKS